MTLADRIVVLNAGRIEQEGTPRRAVQDPANRFVASFIGSPAMNQLDGGDRGRRWRADGAADRRHDAVAGAGAQVRRGQRVTVGMRPEHLMPGQGGENDLKGRTLLVEPTGAQAHVLFELAGQPVTAIVDGDFPTRTGQPFEATIARPQVHVFDAESGLSL